MTTQFNRETERAEVLSALTQVHQAQRQALIAEYQRRSEEAFSPQTLRNYRTIMKCFSEWCEKQGYSASPPITPQVVAEYVESMGGRLSSNTIETRLWALAELHRSNFLPSPCRHRLVELALKAVKRKYGTGSRQAPPLCKREVLDTVRQMGSSPQDLRDKALILTASDSWCRVSELVALRVKDLERQEDGSSLLYISRSKTDQFGDGNYAYLSETGSKAVLAWIEHARLRPDDPIFTKSQRNAERKPLDGATVSRVFKKRFGRNDLSSHSTRVGGVHDAFRLGCSLAAIMVAGRWTSPEMPARYGRRILATQSAAAEVARAFEARADFAGS